MQSTKRNEEKPPDKQFKEQNRGKTISSKTLLREELEKPYHNEDFLDKFDLQEKLNVSAIIPTYNRCPYNPKKPEGKFNPLYWCLESLINQRPKLNEIIVINDNSKDYTKQLIREMKKKAREKDIKFISLINKENIGSSISRNNGAKRATSDLIFFMDDDCIAKKYSIFGLVFIFKELSEEEIKVGAINSPVYTRLTYPSSIVKIDKIGRLNLEKGEYTDNLNRFPKKYLNNPDKFLDKKYKILKPIQIQNLACSFLTSKKRFLAVKGFPRFFTWKNSYGEETELACRFMANGYSLFFCPDPKFGLYHGKFGESSKIPLNKKIFNKHKRDKITSDLSLYEINEECAKPRLNSGNRVSTKDWYYSKIISFFVIFYPRNMKGALNWVTNTKRIFVEENNVKRFSGGKWGHMEEQDKKENVWYTAILNGLELITKKDKDEMWGFLKELEELRKFDETILRKILP